MAKGFIFITLEDEGGLMEHHCEAPRRPAAPQGAAELLPVDSGGDDTEAKGDPQRVGHGGGGDVAFALSLRLHCTLESTPGTAARDPKTAVQVEP